MACTGAQAANPALPPPSLGLFPRKGESEVPPLPTPTQLPVPQLCEALAFLLGPRPPDPGCLGQFLAVQTPLFPLREAG